MADKKTKFKMVAGDPVTLEIAREDGSVYQAKVAVAIFDVVDTGQLDASGMPVFNLRATLAVDVTKPES
jgi:hypothetical protein